MSRTEKATTSALPARRRRPGPPAAALAGTASGFRARPADPGAAARSPG